MLKRTYLVLSLVATLSIGCALVLGSAVLADGQKDKEKAEKDKQKEEKEKQKEQTTEHAFELLSDAHNLSVFGGSSSYLGVYLEEVTSDRAKELRLSEERGAVVMKVVEGSPAEKAGMKENDVITSFNGRRVDTVRELQRLLGETPAGRNVQFEIIRNGAHQTISATMTKRSPQVGVWRQGLFDEEALKRNQRMAEESFKHSQDMAKLSERSLNRDFGNFNFVSPHSFMFYRGSRLGIAVESMTDQLAEYFGVKGGHGVLVAEVKENSAAAKAGLKAGDVIIAIDGQKVDDIQKLLEATNKKEEGTVTLTIVRNRSEQSITLTLEKAERRPLQAPRPRTRVIARTASASL
jgi:C-terminal processing protease CtpA/Prc